MEPAKQSERRRARRAVLDAPILIRKLLAGHTSPFLEYVTKNVSLAGAYVEADSAAFTLHESLIASLAVPEAQRRQFPFARLAGPARVVRVDPLAAGTTPGPSRIGVALEFGKDLTALTMSPDR